MLDYPEPATVPGLNLQCTAGNDVECVTAPGGRRRFLDAAGFAGPLWPLNSAWPTFHAFVDRC